MNEKGKTSPEGGLKKGLKITTAAMALFLMLTGCDKIDERRIKHLEEKAARLKATLEMQADNYGNIANQHNIQLDIKEEGADATINQDIFLSGNIGSNKDKDISTATDEYRATQEKLMRLKERQGKGTPDYTDPAGRMNPNKYDYKRRIYGQGSGNQKKPQEKPQEGSMLTRGMDD